MDLRGTEANVLDGEPNPIFYLISPNSMMFKTNGLKGKGHVRPLGFTTGYGPE